MATLAKGPCIHPDPRISGLCARKKCSYITDWKCLWNRWPLLNAKFWSKTGRRQIMNRTKVTQKNIAQTIVFLSKWKLNFILKKYQNDLLKLKEYTEEAFQIIPAKLETFWNIVSEEWMENDIAIFNLKIDARRQSQKSIKLGTCYYLTK